MVNFERLVTESFEHKKRASVIRRIFSLLEYNLKG